ncbi:MAG: sulfatase [Phycisphaerae bacterium]|nr:sulfatase [Phycisphaerae bacterium]
MCTLVAVALAIGGCSKKEGKAPKRPVSLERPNIVLITVESLRSDHVGCYGYQHDTTPAIDALAAEATLYENAYSTTSWTLTSHACIFTGLYPSAHNVVLPKSRLNDSYRTMAEILVDYGYQTAAVVSGPYLKKAHSLNQGFQVYDERPISPSKVNAHDDVTNDRMEARINHFLDKSRSKEDPFFLFLYYWDPHYQYIPPEPYDTMFVPADAKPIKKPEFHRYYKLGKQINQAQLEYVKAQYDGEVRCTDGYLERLFDRLRELNLWDNTAIILTADHGEQFFEHGFLGHKYDLHVESLHVPLIVKYPNQEQPRRDSRVVNLVDLFPTVLDLGFCRIPEDTQGLSLIEDGRTWLDPTFYELVSIWYMKRKSTGERWSETENWFAIRAGDYKLVWREVAGETELYDLVNDPQELHPITAGEEARVAQLKEQIQQWRVRMKEVANRGGAPSQAVLSPEDEERLRSLGYTQ